MKRFFLIACATAIIILLQSCGSVSSISGGYADEAYITIVSKSLYNKSVNIQIDNQKPIRITVGKEKNAIKQQPSITLKPGTYRLKISKLSGEVIYNSKVFLSTRKTKVIHL